MKALSFSILSHLTFAFHEDYKTCDDLPEANLDEKISCYCCYGEEKFVQEKYFNDCKIFTPVEKYQNKTCIDGLGSFTTFTCCDSDGEDYFFEI